MIAHKLSLEFSRRSATGFPPSRPDENRAYRVASLTHRRWKSLGCIRPDSHNTPTKRFPIFSLRKILSVRDRAEMGTCRATVTTPNNFPWSYFHNKKLEIGFPLTRASICRLRARCRPLPRPFLFPFAPFSSSPDASFDLFRSFGYFPICPRRPWTISGFITFPCRLSFRHRSRPRSAHPRCLVPRRMKSAKGHGECDERANVRMCRSRNHLIVL